MVKRPIWMSCAGVEHRPELGGAAVERHRRGLQLEGAAGLVHAGDGAVEALLRPGVAELVGVEVRQADHGDDFAGADVHDDAAGADRLELGHRLTELVAHRRLHAHVDRQAQRLRVLAQPLVEEPLDAGHALGVHVHRAHDVRRDPALRVAPLLGVLEIDAGDAEVVHRELLARR